jgi:hypothetical protein
VEKPGRNAGLQVRLGAPRSLAVVMMAVMTAMMVVLSLGRNDGPGQENQTESSEQQRAEFHGIS